MLLLHAADLHLGRRRLDGRLPDQDLADAFLWLAEEALREKVAAVLLAGDIFDTGMIRPLHLRQAQLALGRLREAGIPVLAIEGNHDRAGAGEGQGWLDFLAGEGLLIYLQSSFVNGAPQLAPWDASLRRGSWIDLGGFRFLGAGYLGAGTPRRVRRLIEAAASPLPLVLLLHAGPDYFVGEGGGFSAEDMAFLRERTVYLALGHIHRPMIHAGGWACNPGAPETMHLRELDYPEARGCALVTLSHEAPAQVELRATPKRLILKTKIDCSPFFKQRAKARESLEKELDRAVAALLPPRASVVVVELLGEANLQRLELDLFELARTLEQNHGLCAVLIDASSLNLQARDGFTSASMGAELLDRETLERQVLASLLAEHYPEDQIAGLGEFFWRVKDNIRHDVSMEVLLEEIMLRSNQ